MDILIKNASGTVCVPLESELFYQRRIFLEGEITSESASEFARKMIYLLQEDPCQPIRVLISSPGGSVRAGMMIIDCIRQCGVPVDTIALEKACSIAAIILASGTGRRQMMPHAMALLHSPYISADVQLSRAGMLSMAENMEREEEELIRLLCEFTGQEAEKVRKALSFENYFTPNEAVAFGLCDGIASVNEL